MAIPKEDLLVDAEKPIVIKNEKATDDVVFPFNNSMDALMPELEELVKKNPNLLIGCGG